MPRPTMSPLSQLRRFIARCVNGNTVVINREDLSLLRNLENRLSRESIAFAAPDFGDCKDCGGKLIMVSVRQNENYAKQLFAACVHCDVVKTPNMKEPNNADRDVSRS
jgi:hypothetical protein